MLALLLSCAPEPIDIGEPSGVVDSEGVENIASNYGELSITELMAASTIWAHEGGKAADWIELTNPGDEALRLDDWVLESGEERHRVQDLVLEPGESVWLWADGDAGLGPDHLDITLDEAGGSLDVRSPDKALVASIEWPAQVADVAAVRSGERWFLSADPTPGETNPELDLPEPTGVEGLCALSAEFEANLLEGDLLEFQPICADTTAEIELVSGPAGADYDGAFTWQTDGADGGAHDLVFSASVSSDRIPEATAFRAWVADDPDLGIPVDPDAYTEEWGLPVFHLEVGAAISQSYQSASLTYMGETWPMDIKIRGASSSSFAKPSYTLEFNDEEFLLDGWERSRNHLVLLSTFDDNSYVRQKLVYDLWLAMAEHQGVHRLTPRTFFAVVYLDGEYHGLYVGLDKVDDEFVDHAGLNRDGNLYKAINHDANFSLLSYYGTGPKSDLATGYEQKEGPSDFADLRELVAFTGDADAETMMEDAEAFFDLDEFMDWYLLVFVSLSEDSAGKNCYLYNDPDSPWSFRYVPWDFNHSWGQNWYTARLSATNPQVYENAEWNRVFWAIRQTRTDELIERWQGLRAEGPLGVDWQLDTIDAYHALIDPSAERDWARWEGAHKAHWWGAYRDDWTSYDEEKAYLRQWIIDREAYLVDLYGL